MNVERRVKKHLGRKRFKKNDKVLIVGELERVLLERAVNGMPLKITFGKRLSKNIAGFDCVVVGKTMDDINEEFLEGLLKGKLVLAKLEKKFFNILEPLTDEEVKKYAELKRIKFEIGKGKKFLNGLKELKEIKYNLYKSVKRLRDAVMK